MKINLISFFIIIILLFYCLLSFLPAVKKVFNHFKKGIYIGLHVSKFTSRLKDELFGIPLDL